LDTDDTVNTSWLKRACIPPTAPPSPARAALRSIETFRRLLIDSKMRAGGGGGVAALWPTRAEAREAGDVRTEGSVWVTLWCDGCFR
jgi:hypothetical protein